MLAFDALGAGIEDEHPLDHIFQLAHVSRPMVLRQRGQRFFADFNTRTAVLASEFIEKLARQQRNVLLALAQRWYKKWNHVEPVEKILAEVALGDLLFKILVG